MVSLLRNINIDAIHVSEIENYISPSIIRTRIQKLRAYAFTELLLKIIDLCSDEIVKGSAITVEQNRIQIRNLPLLPNTN